jgi:hypothetical protein
LQALEWDWLVCKTSLKIKSKKKGDFFRNLPKMNVLQVVGQPKVGG